MDKALYIAMTGASQAMQAQAGHANNMANASTTGFKSDYMQARAQPVFYGEGLPTRAYSQAENPATDFSMGSMMETGSDLDVAIDGEGFIAVLGKDGKEAYTRAGSLHMDASGMLLTGNGLPVLGNGSPITIPQQEKIEIGVDGTINIRPLGGSATELSALDRIKLVKPDLKQVEKGADGLFRLKDGKPAEADANVRVTQGFLESSNVNAVAEMIDVLALARSYDMQVKMMQTMSSNADASARVLQVS